MKCIIEKKMEFEQDILKLLKKWGFETSGISKVFIKCVVSDFPVLSLVYFKQYYTIKQRIVLFYNYLKLRIKLYFTKVR